MKKKYVYLVATGLFVLSQTVIPLAASAEGTGTQGTSGYKMMFMGKREGKMGDNLGVRGTVTAIAGTSITITGKAGAIYTVDASSATVRNGPSTIAVADIKVGDAILIEGVVNGTTITAKSIMDGKMPVHSMPIYGRNKIAPGVTGTVSAVNGSSLSVVDKTGTTYTVDTTNVKFRKDPLGGAESLAGIETGDTVSVRGTVTGTTVSATSLNDISYIERTVFHGKVTALSGSLITITGMKNAIYTVDASTAKIQKGFRDQAVGTIADIKVGDMITAVGILSGSQVTATTVQDMGAPLARAMFHGSK